MSRTRPMMVPIMCAIATGSARSAAGIARLFHVPAAGTRFPRWGGAASQRATCHRHVKGRLTDQPRDRTHPMGRGCDRIVGGSPAYGPNALPRPPTIGEPLPCFRSARSS